MDSELRSVFIDVVSLPTMITPVSDVDRALCAPEYVDAVIAPPAVSPVVIRPPTASTSAEPNLLSPIRPPASATAVGISSDVLLAVHGRQPFPSSAVQQVMPSYRVRRAAHYMMAMGLWHPPVDTVIRTPMSSVACNACTSCQDCCPRVPR